MKILGIGNAIVDVLCKVTDEFLIKHSLTKSTMKLVDEIEFKNCKQETLKAIRANLALQLFGENIFNRIKNQEDIFIDKAIKTLDTL